MEPSDCIDLAALAQAFVDPRHDREVKRGYLRWFDRCRRIVDIGCGHGTFLDVARDASLDAFGCDHSASAVAACLARGLAAELGDALDVLRREAADRGVCDAALLAHVVEHLSPAAAAELFVAIAAVLPPRGRLVVVTPNVGNLIVLEETFWLDPTHVRPYPRALLARLGGAAGFDVVASYDDPNTRPRRSWWRRGLAALRSLVSGADRSGPMDAVVVFERRPA